MTRLGWRPPDPVKPECRQFVTRVIVKSMRQTDDGSSLDCARFGYKRIIQRGGFSAGRHIAYEYRPTPALTVMLTEPQSKEVLIDTASLSYAQ